MESKRLLKASQEDKRTILKMWADFRKIRDISAAVGLSDSSVRDTIRKALTDGEIEERRLYHGD